MKKSIVFISILLTATASFATECKIKTFAKSTDVLFADKIKSAVTAKCLDDCINTAKSKLSSKYEVEISNPFGAPSYFVTYTVNRVTFDFTEYGIRTKGEVSVQK